MTPMERVLTALSHREPDRVPNFMLLTMHGAKEMNLSIEQYFKNPKAVVDGQLKLQKKYSTDCYNSFLYAPIEIEALGGEVLFSDNGPPNTGTPVLTVDDIYKFNFPSISGAEPLQRVLEITTQLARFSKGEIPVVGVVMSPFSLPVMQLGFEKYLEIMFNERKLYYELIRKNSEFCISWANAQLAAGATAICYFDPVSSPSIIQRELFIELGLPLMTKAAETIDGPVAVHMASGRILPIMNEVMKTGVSVMGISGLDDIREIKQGSYGKVSILGNLNGIEMSRWSETEAEVKIKDLIQVAAPGGGFLLSDHHGEIPYQVEDKILHAVSESIKRWGQYPVRK